MEEIDALVGEHDLDPSLLSAVLQKLDRIKPTHAADLMRRASDSHGRQRGSARVAEMLKLFGRLCANEATLSCGITTLTRRGSSSLFGAFGRKTLGEQYGAVLAGLTGCVGEIEAEQAVLRRSQAVVSGAKCVPMLRAAAALARARIDLAALYDELSGAFASGVPPRAESVGAVAGKARPAAERLQACRSQLPRLAEEIGRELGLLETLLRLHSCLGRAEVLEATLLVHGAQQELRSWREQSVRRAIAELGASPLARDAQGEAVGLCQHCINLHTSMEMFQLNLDGAYGDRTEGRVVEYQRSIGLVADGIVGPSTWQALVRRLCMGWPRPSWASFHPDAAAAATAAAVAAQQSGQGEGGSRGSWAAGERHIGLGPFLPKAAVLLHDLWLALAEKAMLYFGAAAERAPLGAEPAAHSRLEMLLQQLCGGGASSPLGEHHAFACCLVLNAKAAGGQLPAAEGAYSRFRCSQAQEDEVGGLGQWPLVSWFPRTAVVKSQLPRHLPNIVSFLMGRASSPEAHYSCGSQFDRHGQCGDSSQPGASYWLVGVEPCMTLVVLFPGEVIGSGVQTLVMGLARQLWLLPEMAQVHSLVS